MENQKLKIFPIFVSNSGCDYHRVQLPFMYGGQYWDADNVQRCKGEEFFNNFARVDMVVINRMFQYGYTRLKNLKKKHGFKLVVDMDDWWELPKTHPLHQHYIDKAAPQIKQCMELADMCTVTTERLADKVRQHNDNVHIIPNALPFGVDQFVEAPEKKRRLFTYVYAGQSSHLEDVRMISPFLAKADVASSFQLAGWHQSKVWEDIEAAYSVAPNYVRIPLRPLNDYMSVYDNADCSIVPLVDNEFNRCKSNLKLIEAAVKRLPVICSAVPPYTDSDAPVLWVDNKDTWTDWFEMFYCSGSEGPSIGSHLYRWGKKNHNLFDWNKVRFALYRQLIHG